MITEFSINSNISKDAKLIEIKKYIDENKERNQDYKVLDVGGGVQNKANIQIDALFDLNDDVIRTTERKIRVIKEDFCSKEAWNTISDNSFDFTICTHTLEDIRDPYFVIQQIIRVSKEGYIAVPHKLRELDFSTMKSVLGYAHHRWIFGMKNQELNIISKSNLLDYLVKTKKIKIPKNSKKYFFVNLVRYIYFLMKNEKKAFSYREKKETIMNYEIAFKFKNDFKFKFLNQDCFLPPHTEYVEAIEELLSYEDSI